MKLMMPSGDLTSIRTMLPNCGYFGGSDWNSLIVVINESIDWICLQLGTDQPEHLNLQQLVVISNTRDVSTELSTSANCTRSSSLSDDGRPASELLRGGGVHTGREVSARWELRLDRPIHVDRLIIKNRSDLYGARSNNLHAIVGLQSDYCVKYAPYCVSRFGWLMGLLGNMAKKTDEISSLRLALLKQAKNAALSVVDANAATIWHYLQLISQTETDEALKAANIDLLATVTSRYHALGYEIETRDLHQFSELLPQKRDILAYEQCFNRALQGFSNEVVTVSRHFISASKLLSQRELYCALIREIHEIAARCGIQVCLGYGTLLGCIRERGFIPHDDDIDLMIRIPMLEHGPDNSRRDDLLVQLTNHGFQVEQFVGYEHHNLKKSNLCVELFPVYTNGETARLYMEGMKFRAIPERIVFPVRPARLYDMDVNIPAVPEAFLQERYGLGWKCPDRFYEWRWELGGDDPTVSSDAEGEQLLCDFNEAKYLHLHADVASAVKAGRFKNGRSHFIKFGRKEGRSIG